ncbi:MAG: FG-GAP repeat protein [bacterium]|nr:FG-GAP repeat protein [bacterium]
MRARSILVAAAIAGSVSGVVSAQTINEDGKFVAAGTAAGDQTGFSIAVSESVAVIGAVLDDDNGTNSGSAYLVDITSGTQIAKLLASDGAALDQFGWSVAISGDFVIIGARFDDDNGTDSGSAYLFDSTTGAPVGKLNPSDGAAGDQFGYAVAIFGDIAIVGAPLNDDDGANSGSAYLFDVTTGDQIAKLLPGDGVAGDQFGSAVGIDADHAVVGALGGDDNGANSGAAYIFNIATATQTAKLLASDAAASDQFGFSVAVANGTAIIGALLDDDNGANSGSAYLFNAATGSQIAKLLPADGASGDQFGYSVSIGGGIASVGARFDDDAGVDSGSAYFFDSETGDQLNKILPSDGAAGDQFGYSVGIAPGAAVFGSPFDDPSGANSGSAYYVELEIAKPCLGDADGSGNVDLADLNLVLANFGADCESPPTVTETGTIVADDASGFAAFGYSVDADAGTTVVGARGEGENGANAGAAYLFDSNGQQQIAKLLATDGDVSDRFGNAVAIDAGVVLVGAEGDDTVENGDSSGSAYLFDATTGQQNAKLLADDGAPGDQLGFAVDLSGNRALAGAPAHGVNGVFSGAAYIFDVATGLQTSKLLPDDGAPEDRFGYAVAISGDIALVGALFDDDGATNAGSVYVFDASTGDQLAKLTADDPSDGALFGAAIAISGDTAIISAIGDNNAAGAVYLFSISTGGQIAKLIADDGELADSFGLSLSVSGSHLLIGAPGAKPAGGDSGAAYLFDMVSLQQITKLVASDGASNDEFAFGVAIDADHIAVGARRTDGAGTDSGSAYFFTVEPGEPCDGDVNADGATDLADLNLVLSGFGQTCE